MTISSELYMALMSMDSYNRGYGQRLDVQAAGASATQLGNATIGLNSTEQAAGIPGGIAAGFFAQSYTLNGQKIIAYRGTDEPVTLPWSDIGGDVWNGYGTAFGLPFNDQARMAADFFQTVTGTQTTDPSTGNAILTGHSLGGGLAGFIGSIYRQSAYLFDNMSFELAANTARELGIINNTLGFALLTDFYNGLAPVQNLTSTKLRAFATTGELLSVIGNRIMQGTPVTFLNSTTIHWEWSRSIQWRCRPCCSLHSRPQLRQTGKRLAMHCGTQASRPT